MPAPTNMTDVSQFIGRFAPTDRPRAQPLWRIAPHTKCVVTSEDEHAVSMLTLGPCAMHQCISRDRVWGSGYTPNMTLIGDPKP